MERETWYVLEDGTSADPAEVAPDKKGDLMHKSGVRVAMRGDVPSTRGVDPEAERAKSKGKAKAESKPAPKSDRQMVAEEGSQTYKTRGV